MYDHVGWDSMSHPDTVLVTTVLTSVEVVSVQLNQVPEGPKQGCFVTEFTKRGVAISPSRPFVRRDQVSRISAPKRGGTLGASGAGMRFLRPLLTSLAILAVVPGCETPPGEGVGHLPGRHESAATLPAELPR